MAKAIFTIVKVTVEEQRSITPTISYTQIPFSARISEPRSKHFKTQTPFSARISYGRSKHFKAHRRQGAKAIFTIVEVTVEEQHSITPTISYTQTPFSAQISEPRSKYFKTQNFPRPMSYLVYVEVLGNFATQKYEAYWLRNQPWNSFLV